MAVLVEVPYGERCPNKDIKKTSYENCKNCEYKVSLTRTFSMCHLREKERPNTRDMNYCAYYGQYIDRHLRLEYV